MSTRFDTLVEHRPAAARRIVAAGNLATCTIPAGTVLAVITGHTLLSVLGVLAGIVSYTAGYLASLWRLRAEVTAAGRDPLTGLSTRATADQALREATRTGARVTVALADVDWLKAINDNLGRAAGDRYLTAVAHRLAQAVPAGAAVYRYGGDEFLIVAPGAVPSTLAAAIGAAMARPTIIAAQRLRPRASVGIAASGGGDAVYAVACADAAMASAKTEGGARALVYRLDRDGRPAPDGTRPIAGRRGAPPRGFADLAWLPEPGDDLLPVLWTVAQARSVYRALCVVRDRWDQALQEARTGATAPSPPTEAKPGHLNIRPTPAGFAVMADLAQAELAKYTQLAEQLARLLDALPDPDPGTPAAAGTPATAVYLRGISSAFTPLEIEGLVITAAEAVCGDLDDLSDRQRGLAARAYALLTDDNNE